MWYGRRPHYVLFTGMRCSTLPIIVIEVHGVNKHRVRHLVARLSAEDAKWGLTSGTKLLHKYEAPLHNFSQVCTKVGFLDKPSVVFSSFGSWDSCLDFEASQCALNPEHQLMARMNDAQHPQQSPEEEE